MAFGGSTVMDRLNRAEDLREDITLTPQDITELLDEIPDEDSIAEQWGEKLKAVDVKALKVSRAARTAIADALGLDAEELWP